MAFIDKYNKKELEDIISNSFSYKEVLRKIKLTPSGGNYKSIKRRIKELNIDISHFRHKPSSKITNDDVFKKDSTVSQITLRRRYYKYYVKENYTCDICGLKPFWNNQPLTFILDHINGINNDNRIENLRLICPNCNQQLETTGFKNFKNLQKLKNQGLLTKEYNNITKNNLKNKCKKCGAILKGSKTGYCKKCYERKKIIPDSILNRDKLKELIRIYSFEYIGRLFNVSGKAISKKCKALNLPYRKKDINNITNEEWKNI